jgi:gentisate 1,2-dioxygenase
MRIPAGEPLGAGSDAKIAEIAKDVLPTFGLHFMRQPKGSRSEVPKTTTNYIYAAVAGAPRFTVEDGTDATLAVGDVIAVPCWHRHSIEATSDSVIFRVCDEPLLAKLGLVRTQPS